MTVDQQSQVLRAEKGDSAPRRLLTLENIYVLGAVAVAVAAALCTVVRPHDFWWHLAMGRIIVDAGAVPTVDSFTFTRIGEPFFNQMWVPQTVMYLLHRVGGVHLVVVAHAAAIGVAYAALLRLCIVISGRKKLSALVLLAAVLPLSFSNWAVRPQPYAFPLFVAFLTILLHERGQDRKRARFNAAWLLPPLMVLWVNIHGSFVLGLVLVSLAAVADVATRAMSRPSVHRVAGNQLLWVATATWVATAVNPRGFGVLQYVVSMTANDSVATVSEWQPVTPSNVTGLLYFGLAAVVIMLLVFARRQPSPREALVVTAMMLLGFTGNRHTTWFAFAAAPVLCLQIASMLRRRQSDPGSRIANGALLGIFVAIVVIAMPWVREEVAPPPLAAIVEETPTGAAEHLTRVSSPPQRMFNDLGYGSYLAWQAPSQKTFIDPRFELFPLQQVEDYRHLSSGVDVDRLVAKYDIDGFFISKKYQPRLIEALRAAPQWRLDFEDEEAAIFLPATG